MEVYKLYNTNNMEEINYMMPFEMSNYMYMPRTIDPVVEDLSSLEVNKEEKEEEYREKKKKKKNKDYKDKDYDYYYDKDYYDKDYYDKDYKYTDVRRICRMIERYNPGIFRTMLRYGVPYPVARRLCRRIVRLTLRYYYE